ncbi:hypothetical protein D3C83_144020 [compost metagenome]
MIVDGLLNFAGFKSLQLGNVNIPVVVLVAALTCLGNDFKLFLLDIGIRLKLLIIALA